MTPVFVTKSAFLQRFCYAIVGFLMGVGASMQVMAANANESPKNYAKPDSQWGIGLVALTNQKPFTDIDAESLVFPAIFFENQYLHLFGPSMDLKLPSLIISDSQRLELKLPLRYDFGGYDEDEVKDTPILNGMDERKGGIWAGVSVTWKNSLVDVSAEWLSDTSGNSDGQRFAFGFERTWMFGRQFLLTPRVVAVWMDDKNIDYYYGVRSNEIRVDRPIYLGKAGMNMEYGIRGVYLLDRQHSIFIDAGVTSLADEIQDSPLIDASVDGNILIGYRYQF